MKAAVLVFAVFLFAGAGCGGDDGGACSSERVAVFHSVSNGQDVVDTTINGIRLERLLGDVQGYDEGLVSTLLLYGAELQITPPCGTKEIVVVLDQTQVGLALSVFEADSAVAFHTDYSESAADIEPELGNFERWTISWPSNMLGSRIVVSNAGSTSVSTLIKSITFR